MMAPILPVSLHHGACIGIDVGTEQTVVDENKWPVVEPELFDFTAQRKRGLGPSIRSSLVVPAPGVHRYTSLIEVVRDPAKEEWVSPGVTLKAIQRVSSACKIIAMRTIAPQRFFDQPNRAEDRR